MNGQHSSKALTELNGNFPQGLIAHLDTYDAPTKEDLALLFRQFDDRRSARSTGDVAGAYQGIYDELRDIDRGVAKLAIEGVTWWRRAIQGEAGQAGDDAYAAFGEQPLYGFIHYLSEVISVKTPELKRPHIVAAMYATHSVNEEEARRFWGQVARGGIEYEDNAPSTRLDDWLKTAHNKEKRQQLKLKPANFYQGCVYAWNAFREEKPLKDIKFDTKKGYYDVVE